MVTSAALRYPPIAIGPNFALIILHFHGQTLRMLRAEIGRTGV